MTNPKFSIVVALAPWRDAEILPYMNLITACIRRAASMHEIKIVDLMFTRTCALCCGNQIENDTYKSITNIERSFFKIILSVS